MPVFAKAANRLLKLPTTFNESPLRSPINELKAALSTRAHNKTKEKKSIQDLA